MSRASRAANPSLSDLEGQLTLLRAMRERDRRALDAVRNISIACRGRTTFESIFGAVSDELRAIFALDSCFLALCDRAHPDRFRSALLYDEGKAEYVENVDFGPITGRMVRERTPLLIDDLDEVRSPDERRRTAFGNTQRLSRSWMGVPLLIGDDAVGVISLQSYEVQRFDEDDFDLLQRIAGVVAVALENATLNQHQRELSHALAARVAARTEELAALSELAAEMVLQQPLPELIDRALGLILPLLGAKAGTVRMLDRQADTLVLLAERGLPLGDDRNAPRIPIEGSLIGTVVRENRPLVVPDNLAELAMSKTAEGFRSMLSVPLRIGTQVLGTMSLLDREPRRFDAQQIDLAQVIANQLAIAVENARLLSERDRQIRELQALSTISQAASTSLNLRTLLRQVHEALTRLMPLDAFVMSIYDPHRGVIVEGVGIDDGQAYDYFETNETPPPESFTAWIIRHRRTLHLDNVAADLPKHSELASVLAGTGREAVSYLGVPMFDRDDQVIGTIAVQAYSERVFSERDERFLRAVAGQAALHVQNMSLLHQRERQIRELDAIGRIGKHVSATFDLDEMLEVVYEVLQGATGASSFFLIVCEPQGYTITHSYYIDGGERVEHTWPGNRPPGGSLATWILNERKPLLFDDLPAEEERMRALGLAVVAYGSDTRPRSWVGVPLLAQNAQPIGVIALQDGRPLRYDSQTIDLLNQVASHLSLGVQKVNLFAERERQLRENARLFAESEAHAAALERQAQRLALVHRISLLLSSRVDPEAILELAVVQLGKLFGADHTGIVLFDESAGRGEVVAEHPARGAIGTLLPLRGNPIIEFLIDERRPIAIASIADDPRAAAVRIELSGLGVTSIMIAPLISRGDVIGSIGVDSVGRPRAFTDDEQELFMTVASSIASAFENARLFSAEQSARRTADTLREVARVLGSSFDSREVLELILDELRKVINYDSTSIMLVDGQILRTAAQRGWEEDNLLRHSTFPLDSTSAAGLAVHLRRPVVIADTATSPDWKPNEFGAHIRSWLGVPLIAKGTVLGVLNIDSCRPGHFREIDVEVAQAFASQAAVALENAQLYQESVARVEQELEIARRIQSNLFPRSLPRMPGLLLAARCLPARETGGDFYDIVRLLDEGEEPADGAAPLLGLLVGDASGKSIPGAMLMAIARSTARSEALDHTTPEEVMRETNRLIAHDVPQRSFVAMCYGSLDAARRRLSLSNAGQLSPLLRRCDGDVSYLDVPGPTLPLGIHPDVAYGALDVTLEPGDTLVFYTDGIVEAHNEQHELFGFERLEGLVRGHGHLTPGELLETTFAAVAAFSGEVPQHDDMTLLVLRVE